MRKFAILPAVLLLALVECLAAAPAAAPTDQTLVAKSLSALKASPQPKAGFSFAVMGDDHGNATVFTRALTKARRRNPAFIAIVGDLVSKGKAREFKAFRRLIAPVTAPIFAAPGNHDVDGKGRPFYEEFIGPERYAFDYGGVRFIFLDNADGTLGQEQLRWLESKLGDAKTPVIFLHKPPPFDKWAHPFRAEPWHTDVDQFLALVRKYDVPYVFCGHIHRYDRKVVDGTVYIVTGGAGGALDISRRGFYHFVMVTVRDGVISDSVVRLGKL